MRSFFIDNWLTLLSVPGLGGQKLNSLVQQFGSASHILGASSEALKQAGLGEDQISAMRQPAGDDLVAASQWLESPSHHLLTIDNPDYPALLKKTPSPPAALWVSGEVSALWQPQIAVIGSRNPTAGGLGHARAFARELASQGFTVTSGLAAGVDVEAHCAALDAGGQSIAVMGTGADRIYPAANHSAAQRIEQNGALVSELPLGSGARRSHFPARNRIISGLSLGVLVIEAGLNSGTLITARLAAEQGREVFALPGSLHNPLARGCHRLIKQGARLVESTADILDELGPMAQELAASLSAELDADHEGTSQPAESSQNLLGDPDYAKLWASLGYDPLPINELTQQSGFKAREVSSMLLMLELEGLVEMHPGGRVSRAAKMDRA